MSIENKAKPKLVSPENSEINISRYKDYQDYLLLLIYNRLTLSQNVPALELARRQQLRLFCNRICEMRRLTEVWVVSVPQLPVWDPDCFSQISFLIFATNVWRLKKIKSYNWCCFSLYLLCFQSAKFWTESWTEIVKGIYSLEFLLLQSSIEYRLLQTERIKHTTQSVPHYIVLLK